MAGTAYARIANGTANIKMVGGHKVPANSNIELTYVEWQKLLDQYGDPSNESGVTVTYVGATLNIPAAQATDVEVEAAFDAHGLEIASGDITLATLAADKDINLVVTGSGAITATTATGDISLNGALVKPTGTIRVPDDIYFACGDDSSVGEGSLQYDATNDDFRIQSVNCDTIISSTGNISLEGTATDAAGELTVNTVPVLVSKVTTVTIANLNTGTMVSAPVMPAVDGKTFTPTDVKFRCAGSLGTATVLGVYEETSNNVVFTAAAATCTNGAWNHLGTANVVATKLGVAGTAGKGLYAKTTGTGDTTTAVEFVVTGYYA